MLLGLILLSSEAYLQTLDSRSCIFPSWPFASSNTDICWIDIILIINASVLRVWIIVDYTTAKNKRVILLIGYIIVHVKRCFAAVNRRNLVEGNIVDVTVFPSIFDIALYLDIIRA